MLSQTGEPTLAITVFTYGYVPKWGT